MTIADRISYLAVLLILAVSLAGCAGTAIDENFAVKEAGQTSFTSEPVIGSEGDVKLGQRYTYRSGRDVDEVQLRATLMCEGGALNTIELGAQGIVSSTAAAIAADATARVTEVLAERDKALAETITPAVSDAIKAAIRAAGVPLP